MMTPATATSPSPETSAEAPAVLRKRLVSLDTFRGITIVGMILVNNPGTWAAIYPPLRHAEWHGWTPTDLIFPFFLFIVGVAIVFAYRKRLAQGMPRGPLVRKAGRRTLILIGLGLILATFPFVTFTPEFGLRPSLFLFRIPGVLQRIAICYFVVTLLFLYTKPKTQALVGGGLLLGYWALMMWVPVPGYGAGQIDQPVSTLAAYLDRLIFGSHLGVGANREWDPEGLLSTLPAIVSTLFGVWAGRVLTADRDEREKTVQLFVAGVGAVVIGYIWNWFFPINKSIWTSSYTVFTAGQALCGLAVCYWVIDVKGYQRWAQPFVVYGVNAITATVLSCLDRCREYSIQHNSVFLRILGSRCCHR